MSRLLYNKTRGKKIVETVRRAEGFFAKAKGLMFNRKKSFDFALLFDFGRETRIGASIHMLFVFFPIDAVYLDRNKRVVDIARLKPWMLNYTPKRAARFLLELPQGSARNLIVGDSLEWK